VSRKKKKENGSISEGVKVLAGFAPDTPDEEVRHYFEEEFPKEIERPCGVLSWCPYGPLVEQFPLAGDGPGAYHPHIEPLECGVFGHDCPVFYMAEPFADLDAIAENCVCDECRARRAAEEQEGQPTRQMTPEMGVVQHRC